MTITIDDPDDVRIADYTDLRHRSQADDDFFIVESQIAVERLLTSRYPVRSVLIGTAREGRVRDLVMGLDAPVYVAAPEVLERIVGYDAHRGVLASADRLPGPALAEVLGKARRVVILEGSNDHENIGAIARSARALGFDALLLDPSCADPFYRRSVRVSMGEILHLPVVRCTQWPGVLDAMGSAGFDTWALTPDRTATVLYTLTMPERLALVAGNEGDGLTAGALMHARRHVRVPLHNDVDSLNVGHALAIAMAATALPVP